MKALPVHAPVDHSHKRLIRSFLSEIRKVLLFLVEGVMVPWCNPLILQPEQSGGVGSNPT